MDRASKHSAITIAAYVATSATNYAFGVTLSWFFDPRQYGVLGVAQSLMLLSALIVGSGFTWTAAHDLATNGLTDHSRKRIRMALLSNFLLAALVSVTLWVAYQLGWMPLGVSYRLIVPMVGLTCLILSLRGVLNGAARGLYRFSHVALNLVGEVVIKALAGWLFVSLGLGVTGVMLGFVIGSALSLIHSLWIVRPARLWAKTGWFERAVLTDTLPLFMGMVGIALLLNLDVLGLKLLAPQNTGDTQAGLYQAAVILARTPVYIAQALALVLYSYVSGATRRVDSEIEKKPEYQRDYVRTALKTWLRLILPGVLVLILAPGAILDLLFPEAYQSAAGVLQISAAGGGLLALATLLVGVFQAMGQRKIVARAAGFAAGVQILILVWLVPVYGAYGAAISLLGAGTVILLGLLPLLLPILQELYMQNNDRRGKLPGWVATQIFPHILLAYVLIWIHGTNVGTTWISIGFAGVVYLGALAVTRPWVSSPGKHPALQAFNHFVQVLLGG